jgi:hypothetical protein
MAEPTHTCKHPCRDKATCKHACCNRAAAAAATAAASYQPRTSIPAGLTDTKDQVYFVLHQGMMTKYHAGNADEAFVDAENLLLVSLIQSVPTIYCSSDLAICSSSQNLDLPLLLEIRCHTVLSTNDDDPDYVGHARRTVKLLDEDAREMVEESAFPHVQFAEAQRLLAEAEAQRAADMAEAEEV